MHASADDPRAPIISVLDSRGLPFLLASSIRARLRALSRSRISFLSLTLEFKGGKFGNLHRSVVMLNKNVLLRYRNWLDWIVSPRVVRLLRDCEPTLRITLQKQF